MTTARDSDPAEDLKDTGEAADTGDAGADAGTPAPSGTTAPSRTNAVWSAALVLVGVVAFTFGSCFRVDAEVAPSGDASDEASDDASAEPIAERPDSHWTCSMHPQIHADGPGSCPICGMDLIPAESMGAATGPREIRLSERARALAQIRTARARSDVGPAGEPLSLIARVQWDESSLRDVTAWVGGRVDRLHVRATGEVVRRGQTLATIYSPEVYTAHRELRSATRALERLQGASELVRSGATATVEAARDRLRLLGFDGAALRQLESRETARTVAIRAPFGGTVIERRATQGQYVTPGSVLLRVADLSSVWVQLEANETQLRLARVGAPVTLSFDNVSEPIAGEVGFVDPVVDPRTHVGRVRVQIPDAASLGLRPGMIGRAELDRVMGEAVDPSVWIPATAPLRTGRRAVVYVEIEPGAYEARTVVLGAVSGNNVVVRSGLEAGDRVVVHGAFVLDAELEIRGGRGMMSTRDDRENVEMGSDERAALAPFVNHYLDVAEALAADDLEAARTAARALRRADSPDLDARWSTVHAALVSGSDALAAATALDDARTAFEPLGAAVQQLLATFGNPTAEDVSVAFCPMVFDNRGATWVQRGARVDNAYFGASMRTCGTIEETVAPGARLEAVHE